MRGTGTSQDCSPAPHGQELTPTHCSFSSHYSEYFTMSLMDTTPHRSSNTHHPKKNPHSKFLGPHSLPCPWSCFRRDWTPPSLLTRGAMAQHCPAELLCLHAPRPRLLLQGVILVFSTELLVFSPWLRALAGASSSAALGTPSPGVLCLQPARQPRLS